MDEWVSAVGAGVEIAAGLTDDSVEVAVLGVEALLAVGLTVDEVAGEDLAVRVAPGEAEGENVAEDVCVESISGVLAAEGEDAGLEAPGEAVISFIVA